jgi:hypothetical protein
MLLKKSLLGVFDPLIKKSNSQIDLQTVREDKKSPENLATKTATDFFNNILR